MKAYRFNSEAKYRPGAHTTKVAPTLTKEHVQVQLTPDARFGAQYPAVFEKYRLPKVHSDTQVQAWRSSPMQFWQNQLNFAVWCSTAGCGVSFEDHLNAEDPLLKSVYRFHTYYQIRRILKEIHAPLPQDQAWHPMSNPYDRRGYERVCNEFGVSPHSNWRVKGLSGGLGRVYIYYTRLGYGPLGENVGYDPHRMSFTHKTTNRAWHIDYIEQDTHNADTAWGEFILDKSAGFTRAGVERLNDSIRTYVWAILGAQAQTRTAILGTGTAFDAQKQFLANIEDAISSPVDLPSAIKRYQDVLQYARSEVNYSFGEGLYMAPSDMLLRVGTITGYNNLIVIAGEDQRLGLNTGINEAVAPPDVANDTGEKSLVKPLPPAQPKASPAAKPEASTAEPPGSSGDHEAEKTALVIGGIAVGLLVLWLRDPLASRE